MSKEEREIKIELQIPIDVLLKRIDGLGFEKKKEITQRDNYFDTKDWDLYRNVSSLRIRQVNGSDHSFTFKKVFHLPNRSNSEYVEEIKEKFPITEGAGLKDIFKRIGIESDNVYISNSLELVDELNQNGFQGEQVLVKTRQAFGDRNGNEIVIDNVKNVGVIIELECDNDDPMNVVRNILQENEWTRNYIGTGYIWLEKVKGFTDHLGHRARFLETPDWNVLENERDMYESLIQSSSI